VNVVAFAKRELRVTSLVFARDTESNKNEAMLRQLEVTMIWRVHDETDAAKYSISRGPLNYGFIPDIRALAPLCFLPDRTMFHVAIEISFEPCVAWALVFDTGTKTASLYHRANASNQYHLW